MTLPETGAPGTARGPGPCTPAGRSPAARAGSARGTRSGCSCKDGSASGRAQTGCCHRWGSPRSPPRAETPRADTMLLGDLKWCPGRRGHQHCTSHGSQKPSQMQHQQFNHLLVLSQGAGVPRWPCTTWAAPQLPRHPSLQEGPDSHSAGAGVKNNPVGQQEERVSAVLQPAFGWKRFGVRACTQSWMLLLQGVRADTSAFLLPGAEKLQKNLTSPRGDTHRPERVSCWRYGRAFAFEMISCGKEEGSMRWNMGAFFCDGGKGEAEPGRNADKRPALRQARLRCLGM